MLTSDTADLAALSMKARQFIETGRLLAARPLVAALNQLDPNGTDSFELRARLLAREGRSKDALECLDVGREHSASDALAMLSAQLRLETGDFAAAAQDAAAAVIINRTNSGAKALLGLALGRLGRFADALSCLDEAVAAAPLAPVFRQALAEVQERAGDVTAAAQTLADALGHWPSNMSLRIAAIMVAMRRRAFAEAIALCQDARASGLADACIFGLLGHAQSSLGEHAAAAEAYEEARKLAPEDPYVRHLAATFGIGGGGTRAPRDYIETVFDGYAERFEQHLVDLGYRVPGLLRRALLAARGSVCLGDILDLGCGTGFMGVILSDLPKRRLVGVDLSSKMLAQAARKHVYAELRHADLEEALARADENWNVILAADVVSYFGEIGPLLTQIRQRLRPTGICLMSLEDADATSPKDVTWHLQRQGRYAHGSAYVRAAIENAGLRTVSIARETLRDEAGAPVAGLIVVIERRAP